MKVLLPLENKSLGLKRIVEQKWSNAKMSQLVSQSNELIDILIITWQNYFLAETSGTFSCGTSGEEAKCTEVVSVGKTCYCETDLCNGGQTNFGSTWILIPIGILTINFFRQWYSVIWFANLISLHLTIKSDLIIEIAELDMIHYLFMLDQLLLTNCIETKAFTTTPPKNFDFV